MFNLSNEKLVTLLLAITTLIQAHVVLFVTTLMLTKPLVLWCGHSIALWILLSILMKSLPLSFSHSILLLGFTLVPVMSRVCALGYSVLLYYFLFGLLIYLLYHQTLAVLHHTGPGLCQGLRFLVIFFSRWLSRFLGLLASIFLFFSVVVLEVS